MNNIENENILLHEFSNDIYPRKLWVAITTNCPDSIKCIEPMAETAIADTQCAADKESNEGGVLIRFKSKKWMSPKIIAHESTHAAIYICDYIGAEINFGSQEFFAYLVEWIVDCCYKVKNFK